MVSILSLWLPILLSTVIVFVVSAIIHMMVGYHHHDFRVMPNEDAVQESLRKLDIPPGDYLIPCARSMKQMKDPAFIEKFKKGPVVRMSLFPGGDMGMGRNLSLWFIYCLVVGIFAAYIAGRALGPGSSYLEVHRFAGATAFVGYTLALWQDGVWYRRSGGTLIRYTIDGLVYGMLTGGTFGWLWPR